MEGILGYDALNVISLNWVVLLGIVVGAGFTFFTFSRRKWRYKTMTVIAFSSITGYLMYFYFGIEYALPKETLFIPLFLRSFGYVMIAICFLTVLSRVPFQHFFQAVSVQSFVSEWGYEEECNAAGRWIRSCKPFCQPDICRRTIWCCTTTGPDDFDERAVRLAYSVSFVLSVGVLGLRE